MVRKLCMDYITKNADYFSHYLTEPFDQYVERKRRANAHGNHIEMHALSEMYNRPIEIYHYSEGKEWILFNPLLIRRFSESKLRFASTIMFS